MRCPGVSRNLSPAAHQDFGGRKGDLKRVSTVSNSVQQLQEVEISRLEDAVAETLTGVPNRQRFRLAWLLWLNRRLLARAVTLGLVCFLVISFLIPNEYDATTRLMPPESSSGPGLGSGLAAMMAAMTGAGAGSLAESSGVDPPQ